MKRFNGKIAIAVALLALIVLFSGVTMAATLAEDDVDASVTVLERIPGITIYEDAECTVEATILAFGDIYPGEVSALQTAYVKNTGMIDFTSVVLSTNIGASIGILTYSVNGFPLDVEAIQPVEVTFTADPDAISAPYGFLITASGNDS